MAAEAAGLVDVATGLVDVATGLGAAAAATGVAAFTALPALPAPAPVATVGAALGFSAFLGAMYFDRSGNCTKSNARSKCSGLHGMGCAHTGQKAQDARHRTTGTPRHAGQ